MRVESASSSGESLPEPFLLEATAPPDLRGRDVYQIGYPAWDSRAGNEPLQAIFMDLFDVKRLRPGQATAIDVSGNRLQHDCSTLGDTCGAPIIDLESHRVLGLHVGGRFQDGGYAVPLWSLARDPLFKKTKLNFA